MQKISVLRPRVMTDDRGGVYKIMAAPPDQSLHVSEAYYSEVKYGVTKGWKLHKKMTMNLSIACGLIHVATVDPETNESTGFDLSFENHKVITIEPGIWFAFRGDGEKNVLLNLASITHDPEESLSRSIGSISYPWPALN